MRNLPQERLSLATSAVAAAEGVLERTLQYVNDRKAFGRPIGTFQHSRFLLAELATELDIARVFTDHCVTLHAQRKLTAARAAKAKWWTTELQVRVADRCLRATATCASIRLAEPLPTPASKRSTAARLRS